MFSRLSQLARHLSRPLPNYAHNSAAAAAAAAATTTSTFTNKVMTSSSSADERNSRTIHTAACLIIGDEVLGGKTVDTNSAYLAKFCFKHGINLKRVEVIADEEEEIVEAVRRMSNNYDFVVTSGGIGPTHDDITYQSIGNAFGLKLKLHQEAYERMKRLSKPHPRQPNFNWDEDTPAKKAKLRMVELPLDESRDVLFEQLLEGLKPSLLPRLTDPEGKGICRILISTPMSESGVAPYLTELAARVEAKGIKVGSYPRWGKAHNTVTLVGRDREYLESLIAEVEKNVDGHRVSVEGEDDVEGEHKEPPHPEHPNKNFPASMPHPPFHQEPEPMTTLPSKDFNQGPGISAVRNDERPAFPPTVKGSRVKTQGFTARPFP
ncbi:hypothetical protein EYC84_000610 [Monilinia fructicola]|uniref:MoaB/Mog domain-containing protein n=1 Tax=Monilinia fructicola TaxID=38448 RepID=A0A5M9JTV2_MONFR|nr:hypothetical protein EYC84_000610 [Monilinia fructicola]